MTIEFTNNSNVDIPCPTRFLVSLFDAPLANSVSDLESNSASRVFMEFEEVGGPPGILRPGAVGQITVYTKAVQQLWFGLID